MRLLRSKEQSWAETCAAVAIYSNLQDNEIKNLHIKNYNEMVMDEVTKCNLNAKSIKNTYVVSDFVSVLNLQNLMR